MQIEVEVRDRASGKAWDVELPDDAPVGELLAELVPRLGVGPRPGGRLFNPRTGSWQCANRTLRDQGTRFGDVLELVGEDAVALKAPGPERRDPMRRRNEEREQAIVLLPTGNGWIVRFPEEGSEGGPECPFPLCPSRAGRERRTLVFRFRDHGAMIDVLDKACRRERERRKEPR